MSQSSRSGKKSVRFDAKAIGSDDEESFDLDDNGMDVDDENGDDGGHMMLSDMLDDEDVVTDAAHDDFLKNLRKIGSAGASSKKRKLADLYQSRSENSFELRGRVGVDDLLGSLDKASESRKKLQKLMRKQDDLKIAEQLSRPAQERVDREVQYTDTRARVSEWLPTVQAMRKAQQVVFPLPESDPTPAKPSSTALTAKFSAETDLEMQIASVLETSGITEEKLAEYEALQERELSPQEIRERHAQLAKMRSLFFFQEKKNKRLKKIKSKKYRKILRHSKEKNKPTLEELEELDPEAAKEERLKLEKARAEERMTRKHKTTGKWAKYAARSKDERFKDALNDHLRRGQDLMRKINSVNAGDGSDDSDLDDDDIDSDVDSEELEEEEQKIKGSLVTDRRKTGKISAVGKHMVDEDGVLVDDGVAAVHRPNAVPSEEDLLVPYVDQDAEYPTSGVLGMRFMKRAADKKRSEFNKLLTDMNDEDKEWQKKMEAALRENQIAQGDSDEDIGEVESDAGSDDEATERRQQKQSEAFKKKQIEAQKEMEKLKKQRVVVADGGRQKFGVIGAEKGFADATTKKISTARVSDAEKKSMRKIASNSLSLEPGKEGFEIGLSGPMSINLSSSSKSQHVPMDFDDDDEDDDDGTTFNVNKTDVSSRVKRMEEQDRQASKQQQQKSMGKNNKKQQVDSDDDGEDADSSDDDTSGHISFKATNKKPEPRSKQQQQPRQKSPAAADASNPWLQGADDDDADVAVGAAPTGKTSEQKKQSKAQEQEKKEERKRQRKSGETSAAPLRLDLDKIRQDLQRQNASNEPVFNLQTASNTSQTQRDLINRAFAADHITEDQLLEEKNADAAADNEVDAEMAELLMPGWGDWAGPQVQPSKRRQRLMDQLTQKKAARQEELLNQRKDSKMKHVVINEKRNKKFAKYEAGDIPYPYKTREEYEASLRQPLGKEWNTTLMHKAVIKPKVKVKRGKIIEPIKNKQQ